MAKGVAAPSEIAWIAEVVKVNSSMYHTPHGPQVRPELSTAAAPNPKETLSPERLMMTSPLRSRLAATTVLSTRPTVAAVAPRGIRHDLVLTTFAISLLGVVDMIYGLCA